MSRLIEGIQESGTWCISQGMLTVVLINQGLFFAHVTFQGGCVHADIPRHKLLPFYGFTIPWALLDLCLLIYYIQLAEEAKKSIKDSMGSFVGPPIFWPELSYEPTNMQGRLGSLCAKDVKANGFVLN